MSIVNRFRLRYGLLWRASLPPIPWREIATVLACCLVYGLVARIDELGDRAARMEHATASNAAYAKVLRDCMSGAAGFYFPDTQKAYECKVLPL